MADTDISSELTAAPTPVESAREASLTLLEQRLPHEQAKVLKAERRAKASAKAAEPATAPAARSETPTADGNEVIDFGQDDTASPTLTETSEEAAPAELTDGELAKLDDKARKNYLDAHKEAAKIRKRAQEAEAKLAERDTKLNEADKERAALKQQLTELQSRGPALAGNQFVKFTDGQQVADWGRNAQEAIALLTAHERAIKAGRADEDDAIMHQLANGQEIELRVSDRAVFENRIADAHTWFDADHKIGLNREAAGKIAERYAKTKGYSDAREAYTKDTALHTRLEELTAKAALYDTLMARKAVITFPDTVGATTTAPSATTARTPDKAATSKQRTAPPSETSTSAPRMVSSMEGDDAANRKSQLMEQARTAKNYDEQQKYLKQAMMIPSPGRTVSPRRGKVA
jgi:hypothetical protein